ELDTMHQEGADQKLLFRCSRGQDMTNSNQNGKSPLSERQRSKLRRMWESGQRSWIGGLGRQAATRSPGTGCGSGAAGIPMGRATLAIGVIGLMLGSIAVTAIQPVAAMPGVDSADRAAVLSADKKINHLLNRIAFGPRPGDIELVRRMGIDKYID